ncbi:conserved membrane hypothetical protein [Hyphomicrobiales bacterium]|nr:conserved membrane hypothetical protein [Hyphomicrobiales bacterium]CAH1699403.1 conserved membrane hypothetical protein [Hyphomicrobiales bacterium]CAI0343191.1 conserved membrane hypothetical protein [Hyphomicrobiales bacterium]
MSPLAIGCIAFVFVFGGALAGMWLRSRLPEHHLGTESRDAIKLATAIIGTLSALALGLLIASAKRSFDDAGAERRTSAARVLLLDRVMAHYGPETQALRVSLRKLLAARLNAEEEAVSRDVSLAEGVDVEAIQDGLRSLTPQNEAQRLLQARALQVSGDIAEARWQRTETEVGGFPTPFLAVLILWFVLLFTSFGVLAPSNGTVVLTLLVCALSVSVALVLVIDMDHPYLGFIRVSDMPFRTALERLGQL